MLYDVPNTYLNDFCLGVYENQFLTGFSFLQRYNLFNYVFLPLKLLFL